MPLENIDTDQIIPARYLKAVDKSGFGENLFRDWRYDSKGEPIEGFVLNNQLFDGEILLAGNNFGCGSSREHAAWAISQYGFRVVISSKVADIFKNNALNNGLLVIEISHEFLALMFELVHDNPRAKFEVDLVSQQLILPSKKMIFDFEIDAYKKTCLIEGKDDLDYLLSLKKKIKSFESKQKIY